MSERAVLIIEDDPAHARILEKMLRRNQMTNPIIILKSAREALDYLQGQGEHTHRTLAEKNVMIVDLNMPGITGFEFLDAVDKLPEHKSIPRIIVSTSDEPQDVARSKAFTHLAYMIKPLDYTQLAAMIRALD
jgi:CheY-like chemotaxis protein